MYSFKTVSTVTKKIVSEKKKRREKEKGEEKKTEIRMKVEKIKKNQK